MVHVKKKKSVATAFISWHSAMRANTESTSLGWCVKVHGCCPGNRQPYLTLAHSAVCLCMRCIRRPVAYSVYTWRRTQVCGSPLWSPGAGCSRGCRRPSAGSPAALGSAALCGNTGCPPPGSAWECPLQNTAAIKRKAGAKGQHLHCVFF